jgi:protein-S-isoprenylcysteine O-methyltransferase Ste14
MTLDVGRVIRFAWLVLFGVWFIAGLRTKRQLRSQPPLQRIGHVILLLFVFLLLFAPTTRFGFLDQRFAPTSTALDAAGLVLTLAGIAFAVWARYFLGTNWSATPGVKQDHKLIRTGPYAIVRHPIYAGLLLAVFGTALAMGQWRALVGLTVLGIAWHFESRTEERYMEEEFGAEYVRYRDEVKGLVPFVL